MPRPLRDRLLLAQTAAVVLLATGVLTASLWGARRAVQAVSRELVDRAAVEIAAQLDDLYRPAVEDLDSLAELYRRGALRPEGDARDLRRLALPWIEPGTAVGALRQKLNAKQFL